KFLRVERFFEVAMHRILLPGLERVFARLEYAGDEDQRQTRQLSSQHVREGVPGHVWKKNVEDRDGRWVDQRQIRGLLSPRGSKHGIARGLEELRQHLQQLLVVVHHEDWRRHRRLKSTLRGTWCAEAAQEHIGSTFVNRYHPTLLSCEARRTQRRMAEKLTRADQAFWSHTGVSPSPGRIGSAKASCV